MRDIETFPTRELNGIRYTAGKADLFGATVLEDRIVNFAVYSRHATACWLVLFHLGDAEPFAELPIPEEYHIGSTYAIMVFDLDWENTEYGYRFDGPFDLRMGHRFDKTRILLDPYAKLVSGREKWHTRQYPRDGFQFRGRIIPEDYVWEGDHPLNTPMKDLVIYEMHVRGFTMDESSGVEARGTFAGVVEKIPYLKELGINCIEFMPLFEFDEFFPALDDTHCNYWGYATCNFFSPKAGYAALGEKGFAADEMKNMVKQLHKNGIEVILDVVFNHTAEYGDEGDCISFRGIDNRTYYLLNPDGSYAHYSGCGNTFNCNNPIVRGFIIDSLRYWVTHYHIDGFRIDEAPIFARGEDGQPMVSPPLVDSLKRDPILSRTKLISEGWDAGGLFTIGRFPRGWADLNPRMRDHVKCFVKGNADCGPGVVASIEGSPDMFPNRAPDASVNYIDCHDGFNLYDLTAYNTGHNEGNSYPSMTDGGDGCSWNCGMEGETDDPEVNALRKRQMKNMMTLLLLSRGVPMFYSGDEFANTQFGNTNAFSQDNPVSWLDWTRLEKFRDVYEYTRRLIAFRKEHPVIRKGDFFTGNNATGYPELSWHSEEPWHLNRFMPFLTFALMYSEAAADTGAEEDCFIYCAFNAHWEEHTFTLPVIPAGMKWTVVLDSGDEEFRECGRQPDGRVTLMPRSCMLLQAGNLKSGAAGRKNKG